MGSPDLHNIAGFNSGAPNAFGYFFDLYYTRIRYFAYKLLDNKEDSEEIAMESFSKLFDRCRDFNTTSNIEAFLFISTRNSCFNFLKHQQVVLKKQKELDILLQNEVALDAAELETEVINAIYLAIEQLTPERKKVFKLLFLEGMKIPEISERLGISVHTVKKPPGAGTDHIEDNSF
jgi:RNA polymerase sigma-70 factor (family 1)